MNKSQTQILNNGLKKLPFRYKILTDAHMRAMKHSQKIRYRALRAAYKEAQKSIMKARYGAVIVNHKKIIARGHNMVKVQYKGINSRRFL